MPRLLTAFRFVPNEKPTEVMWVDITQQLKLDVRFQDRKASATAAEVNKRQIAVDLIKIYQDEDENAIDKTIELPVDVSTPTELFFKPNDGVFAFHCAMWCGYGDQPKPGFARFGGYLRIRAKKRELQWNLSPDGLTRPWQWAAFGQRKDTVDIGPGVPLKRSEVKFDARVDASALGKIGLSAPVVARRPGERSDEIAAEISNLRGAGAFRMRVTLTPGRPLTPLPNRYRYVRRHALDFSQVVVEYAGAEPDPTLAFHRYEISAGSDKAREVSALWNTTIATPHIASLPSARPDERFSPVPELTKVDERQDWSFLWSMTLRSGSDTLEEPGGPIGLVPRPSAGSAEDARGAATLTFNGLRDHDNEPLTVSARLIKPAPGASENARWPIRFAIESLHSSVRVAANDGGAAKAAGPLASERPVRIGSLDLTVADVGAGRRGDSPNVDDSWFIATWPDAENAASVQSNLRLTLSDVRPGGQDDVLEFEEIESDAAGPETREPPIVVSLPGTLACESPNDTKKTPARKPIPATLLIEEHALGDSESQRRLRASLRSQEAAGNPERQQVVVLDSEPFLVALVQATMAIGGRERGGSEFAVWRRTQDGTGWAFELPTNDLDVLLPPQVMGEEMIRRNEIREDKDRLEYRYSPLLRARLRAAERKQLYMGVPWNLRRVLGFEGQWPAGSQLKEIHYELLYGINCEAKPAFIRLAETGSLLGSIPVPLPSEDPQLRAQNTRDLITLYETYAAKWRSIRMRYRARLAVFEAWDERNIDEQGSGLPRQLTLSENVTCRFRTSADLRQPPKVGPTPDQFATVVKPAEHLAGGATWGFEVAPVFNVTVKEPRSSSAMLVRPAFSSLGGWGFQKIGFDGDRTTIYADTAMGRTSFYSLERLGRVGVFWHPAKHVVVYERTVVRSTQFQDDQSAFAGKAVLRKIREYVEIMQPLRKYPDSNAPRTSCGPVTAVEFKSIRINVDSKWGSSVPGYGWRLPLWNPSLPIDQIAVDYPKPQIMFQLASAGEAGAPDTRACCSEPEKMFFFTSTQDLGADRSNTEKWPPVPGVDFDDLPPEWLDVPRPPGGLFNTDGKPQPRVVEPSTPMGFGRFTFGLDQAERAIDVASARADRAIGTALHNVTCLRGGFVPPAAAAALAESPVVVEFKKKVDEIKKPLDDIAAAGSQVLDHVRALGTGATTVFENLSKACTTLKGHVADARKNVLGPGAVDGLITELRTREDQLARQFFDEVSRLAKEQLQHVNAILANPGPKSAVDALIRRVRGELEALQTAAAHVATKPDAAASAIISQIEGIRQLSAAVRSAATAANRGAAAAQQQIPLLRSQIRGLANQASAGTVSWVPGGPALITAAAADADRSLASFAEKIQSSATDAATELQTLASRLGRMVDGFAKEVQTVAGWMDKLIQDAIRDLLSDTELKKLTDAAEDLYPAAVETFRSGIAAGLDLSTKTVTDAFNAQLAQTIETVAGLIRVLHQKLVARIPSEAVDVANGLSARVDDLCNVVDSKNVQDIQRRARELVGGVVEEARRSLSGALSKLPPLPQPAFAVPAPVMNLVRAFGDPPKLPQLDFSERAIAYYFDPVRKAAVQLSPVLALVDKAREGLTNPDVLKSLSTNLPVKELQDWLGPIDLQTFKVSDILPDFGGLNLEHLFQALKLPAGAKDQIRIAHGVDPIAQRGWLTVDIDVPFTDTAEVFKFGPLAFQLERNARFTAHTHVSAASGSAVQKTTEARIAGNWQMLVGGTTMVTFVDTALRYDGAHVSFNVSPDRLRLNPALSFISELAKGYSSPDSGFSLKILPEGGAEARLDLPIPDVQGATSGISGLRIGASLALRLSDPDTRMFTIALGFALGRREKPFSLTVLVLGGGGFAEIDAKYTPATRQLSCAVHIAVTLSASLAIALGPIRGGVYAYLGVTVDYASGGGATTPLTIGILVIVRGEVSVLGIVSATICLQLQGMYREGTIIATGRLSISIRICWCFTLEIDESVEWQVGSSSALGPSTRPEFVLASAAARHDGIMSDTPLRPNLAADSFDEFDTLAHRYVRMFTRS